MAFEPENCVKQTEEIRRRCEEELVLNSFPIAKDLHCLHNLLNEARDKLLATTRENVQLKKLLVKYMENDDSLISCSQLTNESEQSESEENTRLVNISLNATRSEDIDLIEATVPYTPTNLNDIIQFFDRYDNETKKNRAQEHVRVGVGVLLSSERHPNCVLIGQRLGSHGHGMFALPGGHLDKYESWEACAVREVMEETNLSIENVKFVLSTNDVMELEGKHYVTVFMKANVKDSEALRNLEPEKCAGWRWERYDNLYTMELFVPLRNLIESEGFDWALIGGK